MRANKTVANSQSVTTQYNDIEDLKNKTTDLEATKENVLVKEVSGNNLAITDAIEAPMVVTDFTKNLIVYPYNNTTKTVAGITYTDNGDGSITVNGESTASGGSLFVLYRATNPIKNICFSCKGLVERKLGIYFNLFNKSSNTFNRTLRIIYSNYNGDIDFDSSLYFLEVGIVSYPGLSNNSIIYPMLEEVTGDESEYSHNYVPYTGYDITACEKNLLPYPYSHTTKTSYGITFTDNGDGSITANGTATANASFNVVGRGTYDSRISRLPKGKYKLVGCPSGEVFLPIS